MHQHGSWGKSSLDYGNWTQTYETGSIVAQLYSPSLTIVAIFKLQFQITNLKFSSND